MTNICLQYKLDNVVNKYINTYIDIKMKPVDTKSTTCIDFGTVNNEKDPNFVIM